jgi:hypothetical protein
MMQSQKLPGLKEYGFNELQPDIGTDRIEMKEDVNKISSKFRNENTMAKSNLRQKDKTFNFGLAADFSDSDQEDEGVGNPKSSIDFYDS